MSEVRWSMQVGRFVKGAIVRDIRQACFTEGFECEITEDMGWIDGVVYFVIRDPDKAREWLPMIVHYGKLRCITKLERVVSK